MLLTYLHVIVQVLVVVFLVTNVVCPDPDGKHNNSCPIIALQNTHEYI